jgi:hypothetical protein
MKEKTKFVACFASHGVAHAHHTAGGVLRRPPAHMASLCMFLRARYFLALRGDARAGSRLGPGASLGRRPSPSPRPRRAGRAAAHARTRTGRGPGREHRTERGVACTVDKCRCGAWTERAPNLRGREGVKSFVLSHLCPTQCSFRASLALTLYGAQLEDRIPRCTRAALSSPNHPSLCSRAQ